MGNYVDLTGRTFGKLTVIKDCGWSDKSRNRIWECKCECGNTTKALYSNLVKGRTKSCGCAKPIHYKHGLWNSRIHGILSNMKQRCYNKNCIEYKHYGYRGIKICDEWMDKENGFKNFIDWSFANGYKENLTIDRIDNDKGYYPENCRWTTYKEQRENSRNNIFFFVLDGEKLCVSDICKRLGIKEGNVYYRMRVGKKNIKDIFKGADFNNHTISKVDDLVEYVGD
ncbi:MAG: hypothetical protein KBT03_09690 [Bacteroidales bacterium]|nr:hypothetical protein [Candidatus Scybalousia scybalohippi]